MKKRVEKPENHERWLLTYSDLITLLMIFFVVLYSASTVNETKYKQLATSMGAVFTGGSTVLGSEENSGSSSDNAGELKPLVQTEEEKLKGIENQINDIVKDLQLEGSVSTSIEERGLIISFTDSVFFDSGKADIKDELKPKLISVSKILNKIDNYVRVEGHTDNIPINNSDFHSNWQLSSVRASNVVEFLINYGEISPNRLSAVGYGEYRSSADNNTEEGRAKNRRVDILILNNKFDGTEVN
ncbi:flagellar motor protein MotB [Clostridium sp. MB05]|uniref:flagellar motor protein MotB n=1 Tax=Clostridium sp. MB05 TaxID=3376682 RepID=UPI0039825058